MAVVGNWSAVKCLYQIPHGHSALPPRLCRRERKLQASVGRRGERAREIELGSRSGPPPDEDLCTRRGRRSSWRRKRREAEREERCHRRGASILHLIQQICPTPPCTAVLEQTSGFRKEYRERAREREGQRRNTEQASEGPSQPPAKAPARMEVGPAGGHHRHHGGRSTSSPLFLVGVHILSFYNRSNVRSLLDSPSSDARCAGGSA